MVEYIEREAFIESQQHLYCENCARRKDGKGKFVYDIGDAPCRACGIMDVLDAVEDFPAADVIEELSVVVRAQKAVLDKFPKWIPVTERLPEPNAVDERGFAKGYLVKTDRHVMMHTARYNGEWWILWGKAEVITDNVTHWMPLPEPPKEV